MSRVEDNYDGVYGAFSHGALSRGEFLRLAFGAGMALSGSLGVFGVAEARAAEIFGGGRFPIGAWWPPPPEESTAERYREMAGAGFNFVIGGNGVAGDGSNPQALEAAAESGLRFILTDYELHQKIRGGSGARSTQSDAGAGNPRRALIEEDEARAADGGRAFGSTAGREEVRQRIISLLDSYGGSTALAGVNLYDEPKAGLFDDVAYAKAVLSAREGRLLPYANVWPSSTPPSTLGARNYAEYLSRYVASVKPRMLSFDHYPLLAGRAITRDYFHNWAQVRRRSLRTNIPSWVFIQSVDFDGRNVGLAPRRRPSRADLLWQINVSLAYGAKGIQYFTYWTPRDGGSKFGQALISQSGSRTPLYGHARSVNAYLRSIGKVMLGLKSESVVHAREGRLPHGARPFRRDAFVGSVGGSPVVMGWFRKPGASGKLRHLLVANRHSFKAADATLTMNPRVAGISRFVVDRGRFIPVPRPRSQSPRKLRVRLAPGAAQLFLLRRR